jgi:hypothetical protein
MTLITIFERIPLLPGSKIERNGNFLQFTRENGKKDSIRWMDWYSIEESSVSVAEQVKKKIEYK